MTHQECASVSPGTEVHGAARRQRTSKGFTLIELLIVIGIIGFLAAAILVAVDPVKRIQDARDARRSAEVNGLLNAMLNKQVDERQLFSGETGAPVITGANSQVIVTDSTGVTCNAAGTRPGCNQTLDISGANANCVARLDVAIQAPAVPTTAAGAGGAVDAGTHTWKYTYTTAFGETSPSPASTPALTIVGGTQTVTVTIANGPAGTTGKKIYRTIAGNTGNYLLVGTVANNTATTFTDNFADVSLGAAAPTVNTTGLSPTYIAQIPSDPRGSGAAVCPTGSTCTTVGDLGIGANNTGYYIHRTTGNRIEIGACQPEGSAAINVKR